jgi:hypothetical protein
VSNLKEIIKKVLFSIPVINHLFIFFNYKIFKTALSIHEHKINHLIMTKNNYLIYDENNAGKITGLDKEMNYEFAFSKKIIDFANKDRIFFDVGAAYGHYSWLASNLYKKVYCFEGDQLELFFLKRNMKHFKNVKIIERFLTKEFTIDKIIDQMGVVPNIIKIDVEGEEIQILENCEKALKSGAYFLIEFHRRKILKKYNDDFRVIENFYKKFDKFGYSLEFNGHHSYEKLISDGISDKTWAKEKLNTNNFAIFAKPN